MSRGTQGTSKKLPKVQADSRETPTVDEAALQRERIASLENQLGGLSKESERLLLSERQLRDQIKQKNDHYSMYDQCNLRV